MRHSRWCLTVLAVAIVPFVYAQGQGNGNGNPFVDHADTGETVHVLPAPAAIHSPHDTQPTDAQPAGKLTVYPPSYGSGPLSDHGGGEISSAAFQAIYWNASVANSSATSLNYPTLQSEIAAFAANFGGGVADYTVIQQYGSSNAIAATLGAPAAYVDSKSTSGRINDSGVRSYLTGLFKNGKLTPNANTIYGVYFPSGMRICLQGGCSCSSFCGYHSSYTYGNTPIKYAVFPYANCFGCSLPGKTVADMLTIVTSHEIREAVTDPFGTAWFDSAGYEGDDKCAWHNLYQMTSGSFWVQPEYSNANGGCVVP